jgi:uncharacterized membrane protein
MTDDAMNVKRNVMLPVIMIIFCAVMLVMSVGESERLCGIVLSKIIIIIIIIAIVIATAFVVSRLLRFHKHTHTKLMDSFEQAGGTGNIVEFSLLTHTLVFLITERKQSFKIAREWHRDSVKLLGRGN